MEKQDLLRILSGLRLEDNQDGSIYGLSKLLTTTQKNLRYEMLDDVQVALVRDVFFRALEAFTKEVKFKSGDTAHPNGVMVDEYSVRALWPPMYALTKYMEHVVERWDGTKQSSIMITGGFYRGIDSLLVKYDLLPDLEKKSRKDAYALLDSLLPHFSEPSPNGRDYQARQDEVYARVSHYKYFMRQTLHAYGASHRKGWEPRAEHPAPANPAP